MNDIITELGGALLELFTTKADELGRKYQLVQREGGKVTGSNFSKMLTFGWLNNPEATLNQLCQTGAMSGLHITPQALDQRLATPQAAKFMEAMVKEATTYLLAADEEVALPIMQRFTGVFLRDSSHVRLPDALLDIWPDAKPGKKASQAIVKWEVQLDMLKGALDGPHIVPHYEADALLSAKHAPLPVGSLLIQDLGYWRLSDWTKSNRKGHFILSQYHAHTKFYTADGQLCHLAEYIRKEAQGQPFSINILMGKKMKVPVRLIAIPLSEELTTARLQRYQRQGVKRKRNLTDDGRLLAGWLVFATNAPQDLLSDNDALVLARIRWQIELLFKLWKSHGGITHSRSANAYHILCETHSKLLAMIVQHWCFLTRIWAFPDKSLTKAAGAVRQFATPILLALNNSSAQLKQVLSSLADVLGHGARICKSRKTPRAFEMLLAIEKHYSPPEVT